MKDFVVRELEVDESVYQYLLTACKNSLPCEDAKCVAILEEMERAGHPPSIETYNIAMNACRHAGHWRRCFVVFSKMKKSGVSGNRETGGLRGSQGDRETEGQRVRESGVVFTLISEYWKGGTNIRAGMRSRRGRLSIVTLRAAIVAPPPSAP